MGFTPQPQREIIELKERIILIDTYTVTYHCEGHRNTRKIIRLKSVREPKIYNGDLKRQIDLMRSQR